MSLDYTEEDFNRLREFGDSNPDAVKKIKSPLNTQVGGDHYKQFKIQPFEYITKNNMGFAQGNMVKYASRYLDKNGIEDLEKLIHYAQLEIDRITELGK